jgi:hypothetical protein
LLLQHQFLENSDLKTKTAALKPFVLAGLAKNM